MGLLIGQYIPKFPRVEYYMTELGMSLLPIVEMMYDWAELIIRTLSLISWTFLISTGFLISQ